MIVISFWLRIMSEIDQNPDFIRRMLSKIWVIVRRTDR